MKQLIGNILACFGLLWIAVFGLGGGLLLFGSFFFGPDLYIPLYDVPIFAVWGPQLGPLAVAVLTIPGIVALVWGADLLNDALVNKRR